MLALIPWPYRLLALALLALALVGFGWVKGAGHVQAEWDAATVKQSLTVARVKQRQAEVTVQVVTKYIDRVKTIREKGSETIKEIPHYVTPQDDARCVLNAGFVRLHDDAAAGRLPGAARDADAAPAGIALSAATETIAGNYATCHENAAQLVGLQEWVRGVRVVAGDVTPKN